MHFHFIKSQIRQLNEKNDKVLVNQFPFESNLTVKDLFAATIESDPEFEKSFNEKTLEYGPKWYQTTFNLNNELPAFVSYFQKRAKKNLDNTWILKPWNLARGLDTTVTDNLNHIIRAVETGPKVTIIFIYVTVIWFSWLPNTLKTQFFSAAQIMVPLSNLIFVTLCLLVVWIPWKSWFTRISGQDVLSSKSSIM